MNDQETRSALTASNNVPYIVAVLIMATLGVIAVLMLAFLRPTQDNTAIYVLVFGSLTPTTLALLAFMKAQETHLSVNSRLDQFIINAGRAERAEGELVGRAAGRDQADHRTDTLQDRK